MPACAWRRHGRWPATRTAGRRHRVADRAARERLDRVIRATRLKCGGAYARWQDLLDQKDMKGLTAFASSPDILQLGPALVSALSRDLFYAVRDYEACRKL